MEEGQQLLLKTRVGFRLTKSALLMITTVSLNQNQQHFHCIKPQ